MWQSLIDCYQDNNGLKAVNHITVLSIHILLSLSSLFCQNIVVDSQCILFHPFNFVPVNALNCYLFNHCYKRVAVSLNSVSHTCISVWNENFYKILQSILSNVFLISIKFSWIPKSLLVKISSPDQPCSPYSSQNCSILPNSSPNLGHKSSNSFKDGNWI